MNIRDKEYAEQIIQTLANRYKGKAVPHTLEEIVNENTDLPISWLNNFCVHFYGEKLTKHVKNMTKTTECEDNKISDAKAELEHITEELFTRYRNHQARTLTEVFNDNGDLHVSSINSHAKLIYNQTAKEYLIERGIIKPEEKKPKKSPEKLLKEIVDKLWDKYPKGFTGYLSDLIEANPDIGVTNINSLSRELYDLPTKQYLIKIGFLSELSFNERERRELDNAVLVLQNRYIKNPIININDIDLKGINISKLRLITLIKKHYSNDVIDFLKTKNILIEAKECQESKDVEDTKKDDNAIDTINDSAYPARADELTKNQLLKKTPKSFCFLDKEEILVESWRDLYAKVFSLLFDDYPELIPRDTSFVGEKNVDFGNAYASKNMISPKRIFMHMYLETNYEAEEITTRIAALFKLCGVEEGSLKIKMMSSHNDNLDCLDDTKVNASMDELIGIIDGIEYDGLINPLEVLCLKNWIKNNKKILRDTQYSEFVNKVEDILEDNFIDENERDYLIKWANKSKREVVNVNRNLNVLVGILKGIAADKIIRNKEINRLDEWISENDELSGIVLFDEIKARISSILEDHIITNEERNSLLDYVTTLLNQLDSTEIERNTTAIKDVNDEELCERIIHLLKENDGLRTREIVERIENSSRSRINKILYSKQYKKLFIQDEHYFWHYANINNILTENEHNVLKEILVDDFYDVEYVQKIFYQKINNANLSKINEINLKTFGYRLSGKIIFKSAEDNIKQFIKQYIANSKIADLNRNSFLYNNPQVRNAIGEMKRDYDIIEFEPLKYIHINKLEEVNISKYTLKDYCNSTRCFEDNKYFSIKSLYSDGFSHDIDSLGFGEMFYESILEGDDACRTFEINNTKMFTWKDDARGMPDIIEEHIWENGKVDIFDFIDVLNEKHGLKIGRIKLENYLKNSNVYYSRTMEKIYIDYDQFFEEV